MAKPSFPYCVRMLTVTHLWPEVGCRTVRSFRGELNAPPYSAASHKGCNPDSAICNNPAFLGAAASLSSRSLPVPVCLPFLQCLSCSSFSQQPSEEPCWVWLGRWRAGLQQICAKFIFSEQRLLLGE